MRQLKRGLNNLSFESANIFSKHKDMLLKEYWERLSFEGRYVLAGSMLIQKMHGIDIIIQSKDDKTDYTIDTKHIRGSYTQLFLEELSCSVAGRETPGWAMKTENTPDYIFFILWPACKGCYKNCNESCPLNERQVFEGIKGYAFKHKEMQQWFLEHKENYKTWTSKEINKTMGRNVPITVMRNAFEVKDLSILQAA